MTTVDIRKALENFMAGYDEQLCQSCRAASDLVGGKHVRPCYTYISIRRHSKLLEGVTLLFSACQKQSCGVLDVLFK